MMRNRLLPAIAVALALLPPAAATATEQRIEGTVLGTRTSYCEAVRNGGCIGMLTLQADGAGPGRKLLINVPLGTPVTASCRAVPLHRLQGRRVIVTEIEGERGPVARAISTLEPGADAC